MDAPGRPAVLGPGDLVRSGGVVRTVIGVSGTRLRLAEVDGTVTTVALPMMQAAADFAVLTGSERPALPPVGALDGLPAAAVEQALWWERHIVELLHGLPPDSPSGAVAKPEYDPALQSLTRREQAKATELSAGGRRVSASTVKHRRQRYQVQGVVGLVDHRVDRKTPAFGRADPRVVEAMRTAIDEATDASSRTASYILWRTEALLAETHGPGIVGLPSRRSFYRLFDRPAHGLHLTGSARTRRSMANRPDGPFSELTAGAPGELMQVDSTPLDVLVRLDDGSPTRVELTPMIDLATRTITAAVLRGRARRCRDRAAAPRPPRPHR